MIKLLSFFILVFGIQVMAAKKIETPNAIAPAVPAVTEAIESDESQEINGMEKTTISEQVVVEEPAQNSGSAIEAAHEGSIKDEMTSQPIAEEKIALSPTAMGAVGEVSKAAQEESQIPVLADAKKATTAQSSPWFRIISTVIILAGVGVGLIIYLRKHSLKVNHNSSLMQIKVLTQHHLGPKKTLAVIRVAGESILIGITDQNISMLKSLSLLDEELPEVTPQDFGKVMKQEQEQETEGSVDEFAFANIKDRVSSRLKTMRSLT